jgi:hypothetical protein
MADAEPTLLNARDRREQAIVTVDLGDGTAVRARRLDLTHCIFEGILPTPLMNAAQKLIQNHGRPELARLDDLGIDKQEMLATLRQHALRVVLSPPLVEIDDFNPDTLPVALLTLPELLAIWNQTTVLPKVSAAQAADFRIRSRAPAADVLPARENVRPTPQHVSVPPPEPTFIAR